MEEGGLAKEGPVSSSSSISELWHADTRQLRCVPGLSGRGDDERAENNREGTRWLERDGWEAIESRRARDSHRWLTTDSRRDEDDYFQNKR